jgi:2-haloacid dehalogenase
MKYKCIIFDVGYTLVKHNDEVETKMMADMLNIPYDEDFKSQVSNFWNKSAHYTKDRLMTEDEYLKILKNIFPVISKYKITEQDFFNALCNKGQIGIYEEVIEILEWLKGHNIDLYTFSNWFEENQKEELKKLNIADYFTDSFGWDNSYAKPSPSFVNEKILSKFSKDEVLFVGDGLEKDIKCAVNAGIDSCLINRQHFANETKITPTYEIENLLQIKNILQNRFLVIEGDNGTGKDTLAKKFLDDGFNIITYDKEMKDLEALAKKKDGVDKVKAFIAYNKVEGEKAKELRVNNNVLLIRYFVSSLAAGYADCVYSYEDTMNILKEQCSKFYK